MTRIPFAILSAFVGFSAVAAAQEATALVGGAFDLKASIERGKPVYMQTCLVCHQPTGLGLPGAFPPLAETDYTTGDPRRMVAMLLKGVQGPLKVKEVTYNNIMLPLDVQFPILKDDGKVADVVNYVRNSFGNKDDKGVTPEFVTKVRAEFASRTTPWTEAELLKFPELAK
jgi:mono/diheme cytochrome c family protein